MKHTSCFYWVFLFFSGCATLPQEQNISPSRPPRAGVIQQVNLAEHYFVFESGQPIPPGTAMTLLRNGRRIGAAKVVPMHEKKFQVADILSGAPVPGDLCEPEVLPLPLL